MNAPKTKALYDEHKFFANEDEATEAVCAFRDLCEKLENEKDLLRAKVSDAIAWLAFYGPVGATPHAAKLMENELRSSMANAAVTNSRA